MLKLARSIFSCSSTSCRTLSEYRTSGSTGSGWSSGDSGGKGTADSGAREGYVDERAGDRVFVLNCGSSSIKFQVLEVETEKCLLKGQADRLNTQEGRLVLKVCEDSVSINKSSSNNSRTISSSNRSSSSNSSSSNRSSSSNSISNSSSSSSSSEDVSQWRESSWQLCQPTFPAALKRVLTEVADNLRFDFIGHRVVHGGETFQGPTQVTEEMLEKLSHLAHLAPLHNPVQVAGIVEAVEQFGGQQAAVFDTSYHHTIPQEAFLYPAPLEWYTKHKVRKYGFHGISHFFVTRELAKSLGKDIQDLAIVSCHLGAGCSVTASLGGRSVDTSMGFSPLSGVMMCSRSGDVDPSILAHLAKQTGQRIEELVNILNTNSGLKGISESADSLQLEHRAAKGDKMAILAIDMFCYSVAKYIASYIVPLGRIDGLVFTGGIGENSPIKRGKIVQLLGGLGIDCNPSYNQLGGKTSGGLISFEGRGTPVYVIKTNEELVIAQQTYQLLNSQADKCSKC